MEQMRDKYEHSTALLDGVNSTRHWFHIVSGTQVQSESGWLITFIARAPLLY